MLQTAFKAASAASVPARYIRPSGSTSSASPAKLAKGGSIIKTHHDARTALERTGKEARVRLHEQCNDSTTIDNGGMFVDGPSNDDKSIKLEQHRNVGA